MLLLWVKWLFNNQFKKKMETINGVSFEEYAAACANMAQGISEDKVLEILGLEKPVWDDTLNQWNDKLGKMMSEDMEVAVKYGEIFANPKVGRFSNAELNVTDINDLLQLVPDYETYQKIFWQQAIASKYGIDPVSVLASNAIDLGQWGSLNMHYMNSGLNSLDNEAPDYMEKYEYFMSLMKYWENYWEDFYKDNKVDLSSDIDF